MTCDNLILYYNPELVKSCSTDLTLLSTGAIKRTIVQNEYLLYNKEGTSQGTINTLFNICLSLYGININNK